MAFQFNGFKATRPVACLIDEHSVTYQVFFYVYDNTGKKIQKRFKRGINDLPESERKIRSEAVAEMLWEELKKGWNPLTSKYPERREEEQPVRKLTFDQALDYAIKAKLPHLSKYSAYDYNGTVRFMKKAARACDLSYREIGSIERKDIRMLIATAKEQNSWSANARNKYLSILQSLLSVLVDEELIKFNPAHKIKNEPKPQGVGYKRVTDEQKISIAEKLATTVPDYFDYLMFIYQDGIRRTELLQVRVSDINLRERYILIRPEVAKTNRGRRVPITNDIREILIKRNIQKLNLSWYLFSSNKFAPGPEPYHPNTPTKWWREIVIDGMGIDCKMYSLKHKGADDKILAGLDIDVLRTLYGHKSSLMTEIYAREVKNKYAQQIIEHAPAFARVIKLKKAK